MVKVNVTVDIKVNVALTVLYIVWAIVALAS